jgi:hypothetical protein
MVSTKETGEPAFPVESGDMRDPTGMTLRDYFAAKAMGTLILVIGDWKYMPNEIANFAYTQADAMLKAREV